MAAGANRFRRSLVLSKLADLKLGAGGSRGFFFEETGEWPQVSIRVTRASDAQIKAFVDKAMADEAAAIKVRSTLLPRNTKGYDNKTWGYVHATWCVVRLSWTYSCLSLIKSLRCKEDTKTQLEDECTPFSCHVHRRAGQQTSDLTFDHAQCAVQVAGGFSNVTCVLADARTPVTLSAPCRWLAA